MDTAGEGVAFSGHMAREMARLLEELRCRTIAINPDKPSANTAFHPIMVPDLLDDPINSHAVGDDADRRVFLFPPPEEGMAPAQKQKSNAVLNVPLMAARPAETIMAPIAVEHFHPDPSFWMFLQSRRSTPRAWDEDWAITPTANIQGFLMRLVQAHVAASQGATANSLPTTGVLQVVEVSVENHQEAASAHPKLLPVYLPEQLSPEVRGAVISLLVVGGAAAYTWRYRADTARAGIMPAAVRWLFPGGYNRILAVVGDDQGIGTVGGGSLTQNILEEAIAAYGDVYGSDLIDTAYKAVFAMGAVYGEPVADTGDGLKLGVGFKARRVSKLVAGVDMADFNVPAPSIRVGDGGGDRPFKWYPGHDFERDFEMDTWNLFLECVSNGDFAGDAFFSDESVLLDFDSIGLTLDGIKIVVRREDHNGEERTTTRELTFQQLQKRLDVLSPAAQWERDVEDPSAPWVKVDWNTGIRNVYGARDAQSVPLPFLDQVTTVGVVAMYLVPAYTHNVAYHQPMKVDEMFGRWLSFVGHLHLANFYSYVERDFFPADLRREMVHHADKFAAMPRAMQNFFMMAEIEPKAYPGKNWWVLESPYLVAGAINTTPFSGFGVRGTWVVFSANSWNTIDLTREENLYTAIESAFRAEVSYGGTVHASVFGGADDPFTIMRAADGHLHALAFAPRISDERGFHRVALCPVGGLSILMNGHHAENMHTLSVCNR
ncbi:hypothetical protein F5X68DRAFT_239875 [Plectosphaerella plurivora]|uniref:Uncharacterized protein n=1 Tax=Plectosphaerella plurivora TaxID=936078 RepID=A0A9P8VCS2_9PEZI|nr:hypothetical protein F5X68DRAFT_239875 [Plectosphaerella plurivora]